MGTLDCNGADERCTARIVVHAAQNRHDVEAAAEPTCSPSLTRGSAPGIPEPTVVHASGERWRSRIKEGRLKSNAAHKDFLAGEATESRRVRYFAQLFAKEIVLRNFGAPEHAEVLERLVQVIKNMDDGRAEAGKRASNV